MGRDATTKVTVPVPVPVPHTRALVNADVDEVVPWRGKI